MNRFRLEQRWYWLEIYFQNKTIGRKKNEHVLQNLVTDSLTVMRKFIVKVRETGDVVDASRRERARTVHIDENINIKYRHRS